MTASGALALADLVETGFSRALSPTEAGFGGVCDAVEYAVLGRGALDLDALASAFGWLRQEYPVLAGAVRTNGRGEAELWFPRSRSPRFSVVEGRAEEAVDSQSEGELSALTVVREGDRARVSLAIGHEIADGRAAFEYFEAFWARYAALSGGGPLPDPDPKPLPQPVEAFFAQEGIVPVPPAADGQKRHDVEPGGAPAEDGVRLLRFRLSREETSGLLALGKARGISAHGVVCAALLSAEAELAAGSPFLAEVVTLVDLRPRLERQFARGAEGTNLIGFATSRIQVDAADDPLRWGEQILSDLREQLRSKRVHRSIFMPPPSSRDESGDALREVHVTNWGVVPALSRIEGFVVEDFQGSFLGKLLGGRLLRGVARPGSWIVRSFDGRLGVELCFVSPRPPAEAERWRAAFRGAFDGLLAAAPSAA